jgi:hypothetical protein
MHEAKNKVEEEEKDKGKWAKSLPLVQSGYP